MEKLSKEASRAAVERRIAWQNEQFAKRRTEQERAERARSEQAKK